jgi:hypothetical protein
LYFTDLTVVADSAFLAHFIVSEIQNHPNWSFVSPLDVNRKITIDRDCQIITLVGVGKNSRKEQSFMQCTSPEIEN